MLARRSLLVDDAQLEWRINGEEVEQGCLLWLGTGGDPTTATARSFPVINVNSRAEANSGMFNHPILVMSRPRRNPSKILFLPMTSLNGQRLRERFQGRKSTYHQNTFVPVTPADDHPQWTSAGNWKYRTLTFENGDGLEKPTYVNIRELYMMDWSHAERYAGGEAAAQKPWKLEASSFERVARLAMRHAGYEAEEQFAATRPPGTLRACGPPRRLRSWTPLRTRRRGPPAVPPAPGSCSNGNAHDSDRMMRLGDRVTAGQIIGASAEGDRGEGGGCDHDSEESLRRIDSCITPPPQQSDT